MPYFSLDMDPIDVSAAGICGAQTSAGAGNLDLDGPLVVPANGYFDIHDIEGGTSYSPGVGGVRLVFDSSGNISTVVFTIYGTDQDGIERTETVTGVTTTEVQTTGFWRTVTRIAASAAVTSTVTVGTVDEIVSKTLPLNWRNNWPATFVAGGITGTLQYDIEESSSALTASTDPSSLVWGVTQSNKTADLTGSLLNYSTAARVRWDSYSSGAEMQFSLRQNDYR